MEPIVVGMADCRIAVVSGQALATYALGSCIGMIVYDPVAAVGGLLHFMLPDSSIDRERGRRNPWMFADTGIPLLLELVAGGGAQKRRLLVHAAGGARMVGAGQLFEIGRRNYEALRRHLERAGLSLEAEAVGGAVSRNMRLEIGAGNVRIWEGGARSV